jgi:OFA family oxalate/formate antiporter-like MFS transporter
MAEPVGNRWRFVGAALVMQLCLGVLYSWSVFRVPLETLNDWSKETSIAPFRFSLLFFTIAMVIAGFWQDKKGPRLVGSVGGLLLGTGCLLAALIGDTSPGLIISYGVIGGMGVGFAYVTPIATCVKWFPDKRGLVVGLMVAGYGGGSAIFAPVATALIDAVGWQATFRILGVILFAMGMVGAWLLRNPPAGYQPEGWSPAAVQGRTQRDIPTREMLGMPNFYFLWVAYCLGTTAGLMTISQLVPFAQSAGLGATAAAFAVTVGAVGNAAGRIASGWLSDLVGRLMTLRIMIFVSALAMPALFAWREEAFLLYLFVVVVYWCFGTQLSVFASTAADFFGTKHLGLNYGLLFTAYGVAGLIGPIIAGVVFDTFNDYRYAFFIAAGLAVVALLSLGFARPPNREVAA